MIRPFRIASHFFTCIVLLFGLSYLTGCSAAKNYYTASTFGLDNAVNAVIEIPAGTNKKYEYDSDTHKFMIDKQGEIERVIDFLPYPANYGFIPSTLSKTEAGGDGDALDILVISESIKRGTLIETIPIAVLKLIDDGEEDYKIIAVPANEELKIIAATTYKQLSLNYPGLIRILEIWFLNYNKIDPATIDGWGDEKEALYEIQRLSKN